MEDRISHSNHHSGLWASALLIVALIIVQSGRTLTSTASAEMVSQSGDFTLMTTNGGSEEILVVIDNVREDLLVYRVENQRQVDLLEHLDLTRVFADARRSASP